MFTYETLRPILICIFLHISQKCSCFILVHNIFKHFVGIRVLNVLITPCTHKVKKVNKYVKYYITIVGLTIEKIKPVIERLGGFIQKKSRK